MHSVVFCSVCGFAIFAVNTICVIAEAYSSIGSVTTLRVDSISVLALQGRGEDL